MKISFAADHGGFELREPLIAHLRAQGHEVIDHGTISRDSVDYPRYAQKVCADVTAGRSDRGVICCTTGIGMAIAANKCRGIRAAVVHNLHDAKYCRLHNNANVICFGKVHVTAQQASAFLDIFLSTEFEGGRHERRVSELENC